MYFQSLRLLCAVLIPISWASAQYIHPYGTRFEPELVYFKGDSIVQYSDYHADTLPGTSFTWKYKRLPDGRMDTVFETHSKGIIGATNFYVYEYKADTVFVDFFGFFGYNARGQMDGFHFSFFQKLIFDRQGRLVENRLYNPCCNGYTKRPPPDMVDTMHYEMYSTYEYQGVRLVIQKEFGINDGIFDPARKLSRTIKYSYDPSGNMIRIEDDNLIGVRTIDIRYPGGQRAIISEGCCADTMTFATDYRPLRNFIDTDFMLRSVDYHYQDIPPISALGRGASPRRIRESKPMGRFSGFRFGGVFDLRGKELEAPY